MSLPNRTWLTSNTLIDRIRAKEENAWTVYCSIYSPLVYSWVRKSGVMQSDAADIVQEVFRAVHGGIDRYRHDRPGDTFRGWLLVITRNQIRLWYRRINRQLAVGEGGSDAVGRLAQLADWIDTDDDGSDIEIDDPVAELGLIRRAAELVRQDFQRHTWQAFWRTVVDGEGTQDVASDLEMTSNAVRQARFRVMARLREVIE